MYIFGRLKRIKSILCKRKNGIRFADRFWVINEIYIEKQFKYLEPRGKIYRLRGLDYNVLLLHVEFEGWTPNQVRNWSDRKHSHKWNIFCTSTLELLLPAVSLLSFESSIRFSNKDISNIIEANIQNYGLWLLLSNLNWLFSWINFIRITKFWLRFWHIWIEYNVSEVLSTSLSCCWTNVRTFFYFTILLF